MGLLDIKVLMIHRIFASYRKPIYDKLAERYNYLLLHSLNDKTIHQSETPYSKAIGYFQYSKNPTHLIFESFSHLLRFRPKVVIHEFAIGMLSLLPMYIVTKLMGAKFVLYSHGYNRITGFNPQTSWADKYRVFLMKLADATVIYTNTDKKMLSYHTNPEKLFVAQNTLENGQLLAIRNELEKEGKEAIKAKLGFNTRFNLIFIGRLLEEKMPDKVLDVFELIHQQMPGEIGVHFVGGGNMEPLKSRIAENGWGDYFHFYGAIYDDRKTGEYLFASDMMIMPGYLGLAVNHAFMFDCPVISFSKTKDGPFHSPEIEYVVQGKTGFLVEDLSVPSMAAYIIDYLKDQDWQQEMKKAIRYKMEVELTTDNMVKGFTGAIEYTLGNKKSA